MAATYKEIADEILPATAPQRNEAELRSVGKTDAQLTEMSRTMPDSLNVEELLFAATLTNDLNEQLRIYKETERVHANDYRGANNVGYIYMMQNKLAEAEAQFQKANSITDNPVSTNNLGVVARLKGDRKKAAELYNKAMAAGPEVKYNLGIINIQNGDYASCQQQHERYQELQRRTWRRCSVATLPVHKPSWKRSSDKDSAMGHYLMAIIGARQNNGDMVRNHLGMAVQKDASLREKAMKDLEFREFKDNLGI